MKIKKKWIITIGIVLILAIIIYTLSYLQVVIPKSLILQNVTVDENYITVSGFHYGGLFNYQSYETNYKDGVLYIKYRGGWELPYMKGTNSPEFYPVPNKYPDLKEIYLWGNDSSKNNRLIWTAKDGVIKNPPSLHN